MRGHEPAERPTVRTTLARDQAPCTQDDLDAVRFEVARVDVLATVAMEHFDRTVWCEVDDDRVDFIRHLVAATTEAASAALLAVDDLPRVRQSPGHVPRRAARRNLERRVRPAKREAHSRPGTDGDRRAILRLCLALPCAPDLMDEAGSEALRDAIRHMHGCESTFVESVPVHETFNGEVVWNGEVQVYDLIGHPKAKRAYAWSHVTKGTKRRFYAVLELGPVKDAVTAVRAASAADAKVKSSQAR